MDLVNVKNISSTSSTRTLNAYFRKKKIGTYKGRKGIEQT